MYAEVCNYPELKTTIVLAPANVTRVANLLNEDFSERAISATDERRVAVASRKAFS